MSSITAVSGTPTNLPPSNAQQGFAQLASALRSGDLDAAQQAYSALTQTSAAQSGGPFAQAVSQIGDALQSGDLGQAQQALAALQQQAKGAHHHGGHRQASASDQTPATAPPAATTSAGASTSSTNAVDVTA
jgi:thioredoxin-like negative regulator of GroEL